MTPHTNTLPPLLAERVRAYEAGEQTEAENVAFFQYLSDTGWDQALEPEFNYARVTEFLVDKGLVKRTAH